MEKYHLVILSFISDGRGTPHKTYNASPHKIIFRTSKTTENESRLISCYTSKEPQIIRQRNSIRKHLHWQINFHPLQSKLARFEPHMTLIFQFITIVYLVQLHQVQRNPNFICSEFFFFCLSQERQILFLSGMNDIFFRNNRQLSNCHFY